MKINSVSVPVLGIIFLSVNTLPPNEYPKLSEFPSPYWGLFFYQKLLMVINCGRYLKRFRFRPRTGDYFFINCLPFLRSIYSSRIVSVPVLGIIFLSVTWKECVILTFDEKFPSPYWGLFFYLPLLIFVIIPITYIRFSPRTGDYFFIHQ